MKEVLGLKADGGPVDGRVVVDGAVEVDIRTDGEGHRLVLGPLELELGLSLGVPADTLPVAGIQEIVGVVVVPVRVAAILQKARLFIHGIEQRNTLSVMFQSPISIDIL